MAASAVKSMSVRAWSLYVQRLATKGGLPPKGRCAKSPSAATSVMLPNPGQ
jgi:hypothetical protein